MNKVVHKYSDSKAITSKVIMTKDMGIISESLRRAEIHDFLESYVSLVDFVWSTPSVQSNFIIDEHYGLIIDVSMGNAL